MLTSSHLYRSVFLWVEPNTYDSGNSVYLAARHCLHKFTDFIAWHTGCTVRKHVTIYHKKYDDQRLSG